jgi:hypothetical protein
MRSNALPICVISREHIEWYGCERNDPSDHENDCVERQLEGGDSSQGALCSNLHTLTLNQRKDYDEYMKQLKTRQDRNLAPIGLPDDLNTAVCAIQREYKQYHTPLNRLADNLLIALKEYIDGDRQNEQFILNKYIESINFIYFLLRRKKIGKKIMLIYSNTS